MNDITFCDLVPIQKIESKNPILKFIGNNLSSELLYKIFQEIDKDLYEMILNQETEDDCINMYCHIKSFFYACEDFKTIDQNLKRAVDYWYKNNGCDIYAFNLSLKEFHKGGLLCQN